MVFGSESPGGEEKATPKLYLDYKKKTREVTHIYNNQPLIGKIMTEEERKRLALKRKNKKFFDDYRKGITGVAAGEKEMEILTKSIPNLTQKKDTSEKMERLLMLCFRCL